MSHDTVTLSGAFTYLELLAMRASRGAFSQPALQARRGGAPPHVVDELERAEQLALGVEQQLADLDRRKNELSLLLDTARALTEGEDLEALLTTLVRRSRLLLHVDMAWVVLLDGEDDSCVRATDGAISVVGGVARAPVRHGLSAIDAVGRSAVWTSDCHRDDTFGQSEEIESVVLEEGLTALLAVPLRSGGKVVGVLFGGDRVARSYTADEVAMMSTLADYATSAVKWVRAVEQTRDRAVDLAVEVDRLRIRDRARQQSARNGHRLVELALAGVDVTAFTAAVGDALGGSVWLRDEDDGTLARTSGLWDDEEELAAAVFTARAEHRVVQCDDGVTVAPVRVAEEDLGALVLRCHPRDRTPDAGLLQYAVQAAAILITLDRGADSTDRRFRDEALDRLLNGGPFSRRCQMRLQHLGLDLSRRHAVIVAEIPSDDWQSVSTWTSTFVWLRGGARTIHNGRLVLLLPHSDAGEAAREVMQRLGKTLGRPVPVGAASARGGPEELLAAHEEAVACLEVLTILGDEDARTPATAVELGFVGMLLGGSRDIGAFIEQTLGPIISYDEQRSTNLAATLEAYFAAGASPTHAAAALRVHTNTVARRLERISQLLGPDWQQPGPALEIQLALRLYKVSASLRGRARAGSAHALSGQAMSWPDGD
ncbi:helix-turn-helix domain-containing protein [Streptomyces sp. CBMA152]|uniref:helix-turn-helix domain-containing protein n=1 Tax=Streptomyces sp. CBMA152 TaxID=1896312 RepID=UPI001661683C|nr:helix-turn-helix domain-containing protein [Streptomyces sp. CBMA152]MBD0741842.1 hypothetical protein [Streptomyces sp. CBMA152]